MTKKHKKVTSCNLQLKIKDHQNFKTATYVENVSLKKLTQPREAKPRRQKGQVSQNHFNAAFQGGS